VKARGRRFEAAGLGAYLGGVAHVLSLWVWLALTFGFILGGLWLQWRAERKHKSAPHVPVINTDLSPSRWRLFQGELHELVDRYRKGRQ
jgi:hypothetical protein